MNNSVVTVYDTFSCEKSICYERRLASLLLYGQKGDRQIATVGRDGSVRPGTSLQNQRAEEAEGAPKAPFYDGAASVDLKRVFALVRIIP